MVFFHNLLNTRFLLSVQASHVIFNTQVIRSNLLQLKTSFEPGQQMSH